VFMLLFHNIGLQTCFASNADFHSSPSVIKPLLTPSLVISCSLKHTAASSTGSLVGRGVSYSNIDTLTSLVIVKDGHAHIAKVSSGSSAELLVRNGSITAVGHILGNNGYLNLTWDFPTADQVGHFACQANGVDSQSHNATVVESLRVTAASPTMDDIVSHIHGNALLVRAQQDEILKLKAEISDLKKNDSQLVDRMTHVETGVSYCGASSTWHVGGGRRVKVATITFSRSYSSPPVVQLAPKYLNVKVNHQTWYSLDIVEVDTKGFKFTCDAYIAPQAQLDGLGVSWMSVPQ